MDVRFLLDSLAVRSCNTIPAFKGILERRLSHPCSGGKKHIRDMVH